MKCLVLEGGGSRGAYHVGAIKAYLEHGHTFEGVFGTSIGAINSAFLAEGDFVKLAEFWETSTMSMLFDFDENEIDKIKHHKFDFDVMNYVKGKLKESIATKGINTDKIRTFLEKRIDEDKIRNSGIKYGLVTFCISNLTPHELLISDIPKGMLIDYIMASSCFPGFKPVEIDGHSYIDGGFCDNLPINIALKNRFDDIVAIKTFGPGIVQKPIKNNANITYVSPSEDLGPVMYFSPENAKKLMTVGYYDAMRKLKSLKGKKYYFLPSKNHDYFSILHRVNEESLKKVFSHISLEEIPVKRALFERLIPSLGNHFGLDKDFDYEDFVLYLFEFAAEIQGIERYNILELADLKNKIHFSKLALPENKGILSSLNPLHNRTADYDRAAILLLMEITKLIK